MSTTSLELSRQYTSFSGVDIRAVVQGETIGALQAISYAIQREKAPIYVMGRVDPLSFSRGKRGIAGTIITLMLDQHVMLNLPFNDMKFVADNDEIYPSTDELNNAASGSSGLEELDTIGPTTFDAGDLGSNFTISQAWYVDQIPPFDAVIVAANEYGQAATMRIYGIEILNEGSGFSIDDIVIENQMTYVCRTILPWQKLGSWDFNATSGNPFKPSGDGSSVGGPA
jgi:hypothetical protein